MKDRAECGRGAVGEGEGAQPGDWSLTLAREVEVTVAVPRPVGRQTGSQGETT